MADSTRERMANRLRTLRDRESYRTLFACTAVEEAAKTRTHSRVDRVQLVDITFFDEAGDEVEPLEKVTVKLASDLIAQSAEPMVVQVDHDGTGSVVDTLDDHELELRNESAAEDELAFDASK